MGDVYPQDALRDALLDIKKQRYLGVKDETVNSDETLFTSSGTESAYNNLTIDGYYRNDGGLTVKNILTVNGILDNRGTLEIGW